MAQNNNLKGTVENRNDGVLVYIQGGDKDVQQFKADVESGAPPASGIRSVRITEVSKPDFADFRIVSSKSFSDEITLVSPDIAVCSDCLEDMKRQPGRLNHPFVNCTNCGPRFSIIRSLPYDRSKTTMDVFKMCGDCSEEYENVLDRRFHAQPVACLGCGPRYELITCSRTERNFSKILAELIKILEAGGTVAIKGLGGYFLACDAASQAAVSKLRQLKIRENKPFAVMFADLNAIHEYANTTPTEEQLLLSWKRPIVLIRAERSLAPGVSVGFSTIGAMLPYMPLHYLLFEHTGIKALVLTSGNFSDEPILIDDKTALDTFKESCDAVLTHNRIIHNRVDDSVTMVVGRETSVLRRSRGYVPAPVMVDMNVEGIIATGAELVNCFCVGKGNQALLSQHIGDLKNMETYIFYQESLERFIELFRVDPELYVCDLHPEYLSTKYALTKEKKLLQVQHHHAHIASCMAEHALDEKVIGVAFDGAGLGDDGNIWGGEFLISDFASYTRAVHFDYVPMPGGDMATLNPWRMAVSYLYRIYGIDMVWMDLPFLKKTDPAVLKMVLQMIDQNINTPYTSSVGRLFDAVSALTNVCTVSGFHAEAPMRLESVASGDSEAVYKFVLGKTIVVDTMIKGIVKDLITGVSVQDISLKFHNTIGAIILDVVRSLQSLTGINKVVLSGGTFQNRYLIEHTVKRLRSMDFEVYSHRRVPCNDGGIALGQIAIAAKKRESGQW